MLKNSSYPAISSGEGTKTSGTFLNNSSVLNIFNVAKINRFKSVLDIYLACVENIKKIQDVNKDIDSNKVDGLKETIAKINESVESVEDPYYFKEQQKTLSKYVHSINSINVNKVNSLNKLLSSMNHLAYKMGNLDKFTKVLADDMAAVLNKLAAEMKNAKATIKEAERLQNMREQSIKNSINEIKKLMDEPMTVEIYQSSTGDESVYNTPPGGPTQLGDEPDKNTNDKLGNGPETETYITQEEKGREETTTIPQINRGNGGGDRKEFGPDYTQSEVNKMILAGIDMAFKTGVKINKTGNVITINGSKV